MIYLVFSETVGSCFDIAKGR